MKKCFLILALFSVGLIYSQDSTHVEKWGNGVLKIEGKYLGEKKQGAWKRWNDKGELVEMSEFDQGNLMLKTVNEYYSHTENLLYEKRIFKINNKLLEKRLYSFQNNKRYTLINYYDNGKVKSTGQILNDQKNGKWITYDEDGAVLSKNRFKEGIHMNNPNDQIIKAAEKEKERELKVKKDSVEKEVINKKIY